MHATQELFEDSYQDYLNCRDELRGARTIMPGAVKSRTLMPP